MNNKIKLSGAHFVEHRSPPKIWQDGFPIGNGFLGAMMWGDGHPLNFTLDCADLWDNRQTTNAFDSPDYNYANLCRLIRNQEFDQAQQLFGSGIKSNNLYPTKISIGRMELDIGPAQEYSCRLDLDRAAVAGRIVTRSGKHDVSAFVSKDRHLMCVRVTNLPKRARLKLRPLSAICPAMEGLGYPPPEYSTLVCGANPPGRATPPAEPLCVMAQTLPGGLCYAVAWNDAGDDRFIAVETADTAAAAADKAAGALAAALRAGFDKLYREHTLAWREFWSASAVVLPEPAAEFYWYYGVYLLASSARRGHMPPGLQGVWAMDGVLPPWRGDYHNDLNVQETFWPAGASGHLDLLDCWCDYMVERLPAVLQYTRRFFATEGAFWPCVMFGKAPPGGTGSVWYALNFSWSHGLWLGWLVWLRWRYSLDKDWLRRTGYPLLAEMFKFVRANLQAESDGYLHVPFSASPEYFGHDAAKAFCKDPNIDLALIRKCCDWIVEVEAALGTAELTGHARNIREKLAPYALSEKQELCLWPGKLLDESHRHPSQLMAIHPAMDLTVEGDEQTRAIIAASINQFLGLGQYQWAGHTYAQMISMAAVLGCPGWAYESLRQFMEHWTMPNGLHVNSDWRATGSSAFAPLLGQNKGRERARAPFTMESNNAVSAGIGDMLVQGWGGKLRVFPAVPHHWRDVACFDLRSEGGWKVSAVRRRGQTVWVRVAAGVGGRLALADPFDGARLAGRSRGIMFRRGVYYVNLRAGESVVFRRRDYIFDARRAVADVRSSGAALLGLPEPGRLAGPVMVSLSKAAQNGSKK